MISSHRIDARPGRLAYVTVTVSGDRLSPEYWTDYFGVEPTFYVEKGKPFVTPAGKLSAGIGQSNIWGYSTKGIVDDDELDPHLRSAISNLNLPRADLKKIVEENGVSLRFSCYWANFGGNRVPHIDDRLKEVVSESGGTVLIDEYSYG